MNLKNQDKITYRKIDITEIDKIAEIDASCYIEYAYRRVGDKRQMIYLNYNEPGFPEGIEHHKLALEDTIKQQGYALGAFNEHNELVGFLTLNPKIFGKTNRYLLLDQLFISKPFRKFGIGKKLFDLSVIEARQRGANKIYICAGSSADTIMFYKKIGCHDASEINFELYDQDPRDFHMEFDL